MRRLGAACLDGRITSGELAARAAEAQTASTITGLYRVTADLPAPAAGAVTGQWRRARRLMLASLTANSGWPRYRALGHKVIAVAAAGEVVIDLRLIPVTSYRTEITAVAVLGEVLVIVPPCVRVIAGAGVCVAGYVTCPEASPVGGSLVPVVEVRSFAFLGDVRVRREPGPGGKAWHQDGLWSV